MKKIFFTMILTLSLPAFAAAESSPPAYQFSLDAVDGSKVELAALKGKVVFLDFWAGWCPPCRASLPAIKRLHEKYTGRKDFVVVGINMENMATAKKYAEEKGLKYINAVGDDITARRYGVRGIPTFILIDKKGEIAKRWVGFSETLFEEWTAAVQEALAYEPPPPKPSPKPAASRKKTVPAPKRK